MAVGNTWFIRYRARAMTVISSAVPIGGTLLTPLLALAVQAWGWRTGAILAGTLFLVIGIPLGIGVRRSPESMGLLPDGSELGSSLELVTYLRLSFLSARLILGRRELSSAEDYRWASYRAIDRKVPPQLGT